MTNFRPYWTLLVFYTLSLCCSFHVLLFHYGSNTILAWFWYVTAIGNTENHKPIATVMKKTRPNPCSQACTTCKNRAYCHQQYDKIHSCRHAKHARTDCHSHAPHDQIRAYWHARNAKTRPTTIYSMTETMLAGMHNMQQHLWLQPTRSMPTGMHNMQKPCLQPSTT